MKQENPMFLSETVLYVLYDVVNISDIFVLCPSVACFTNVRTSQLHHQVFKGNSIGAMCNYCRSQAEISMV